MKGIKLSFKKVYGIYVLVLLVLCVAAIIYVNGLLRQYEEMRPEQRVKEAITMLAQEAEKDNFFATYGLADISVEKFEEQVDVKSNYLALYDEEKMSFSSVNEKSEEDVLYYEIKNAGKTLAKVKLKAVGPAETKLAVFSYREWQIEEITPLLEKNEYTILVPMDFSVSVNGIPLTEEDGTVNEERITYTISGLYLEPNCEIKDKSGAKVNYTVENDKVLAEFYYYSLVLPESITVHLNGELLTGEKQNNNRVFYNIQMLEKPEIVITDYYGNSVNYDGKNTIPLTYMTVLADSRYSVKVDGKEVAKEAVTTSANKEYEQLVDYVENLPQVSEYDVAILKNDAEVSVVDELGNSVSLEPGKEEYDLVDKKQTLDTVPEEVSKEIDILKVTQDWSLFLSRDKWFAEIEHYFIIGSYQHNMAHQYATGIDITFTSSHVLANPAFSGNQVTNFYWIAENCFSVDVNFVKHMILATGMPVDDVMNDRFYFVKYDGTDDGIDNPTWKIVSMREIIENGN